VWARVVRFPIPFVRPGLTLPDAGQVPTDGGVADPAATGTGGGEIDE
jgi:hypothetical protein